MDSKIDEEFHDIKLDRLSIWRKLAFGIGGLPMQLTSSMISFYLSIFLLEIVRASPSVFVTVMVAGRVSDAITDVFAGYVLQKYSETKNVIKVSMGISTILLSISLFLLFFNIRSNSHEIQALFYSIIIICFQTSMTFYFIPYVSLTMRASAFQDERDSLTSFRMIFEILGLLLGAGLFGNIITTFRPTVESCKLTNSSDILIEQQEMGYMIGSSICIFIIIICSAIAIGGIIEKDIYKEAYHINFKFFFKILQFRPYMLLMATFACSAIGMMVVQANMALYIIHVLKMPYVMAYGILVMMACSIFLIPVAHFIIIKLGKKVAYYSGMVAIFPVLILLLLLPEHVGNIIFFLVMIYTSYPVMVAFLLPWSMLPDCIDYFVILNGIRKEAAFYSLFVFFQKFAIGFTVGMTGIVLALSGYNSKMCAQTKAVEDGLRYMMGFGSMIFFFGGIIFLYFYPINNDQRLDIKYRLSHKMRARSQLLEQTIHPTTKEFITKIQPNYFEVQNTSEEL